MNESNLPPGVSDADIEAAQEQDGLQDLKARLRNPQAAATARRIAEENRRPFDERAYLKLIANHPAFSNLHLAEDDTAEVERLTAENARLREDGRLTRLLTVRNQRNMLLEAARAYLEAWDGIANVPKMDAAIASTRSAIARCEEEETDG